MAELVEILDRDGFKEKVFDFEKHDDWVFEGDKPTIVDFYADWCTPCHMLAPILQELADEYSGRLDIYKVNTEELPDLAALFEVRGIPALLFIPKDAKPTMVSGFMPMAALKDTMKEIFGPL